MGEASTVRITDTPISLAIVLRTSRNDNSKPRPDWFSKSASARSLNRAVAACRSRGDVVYVTVVADGGLPEGTESEYGRFDSMRVGRFGNNRRSFLAALETAIRCVDLGYSHVFLVEDDYIFRREALLGLLDAIQAIEADYFTVYCPDDREWHANHRSQVLTQPNRSATEVGGTVWRRISHSTSTFAVSAEALRADSSTMRLVTYVGSPFAHAMSSVLQGFEPFSWRHIMADLNWRPSPRSWARAIARPPMRAIANVAALRMRSRHRRLYGPVPDLATHAETGFVAPGTDWRRVAQEETQPD